MLAPLDILCLIGVIASAAWQSQNVTLTLEGKDRNDTDSRGSGVGGFFGGDGDGGSRADNAGGGWYDSGGVNDYDGDDDGGDNDNVG